VGGFLLAVLQAFTVIIVVIVVGVVVGWRDVLGDNARTVLNRTAFHIGVPALLLISLADSEPSQVFSPTLLVSGIAALTIYALYFIVATAIRWPRGEATIGAMLASYVNAGNLGIPISAYVLGSTTEVSALILFQILVLVPISMGLLDSDTAQHRSVGARIGTLAANPIIAASAVGLALMVADIEIPEVLHNPLELLSALAVPTVLLAFGISLTARGADTGTTHRGRLGLAVACKLVLMPALAYSLARFGFGADQHQLLVVTVLAALPSAQNINTYAALYQRGDRLARDTTLVSTLLSVPVIIVVVFLLTG
jgi:malonate transporter and related proteins